MNFRSSFLPPLSPVIKNLLIINALVFLAQQLLQQYGITELLALHYPASEGFKSYQLITYMFLHGDFWHLFFNMFSLFMFGIMLENIWGSKRFLTYYMVTGIGAGLIQILVSYFSIRYYQSHLPIEIVQQVFYEGYNKEYLDPTVQSLNAALNTSTIGASGAVFGILLAFGMLFPNSEIMLMFPPIPIKAKYFVFIYGALELYLGWKSYGGDNVAHFAHLGGMLFGFFMIRYWRSKGIY
jgi:membrane associated rhomboid family serine protease